jgi:hypothetical protein
MSNFKYYELIAFFYAGIFGQIKQGIAFEMAINVSFDSFWLYPEDDNRLSNLIVLIHYLNVEYATHKVFTEKQVELYKNQLELIKDDDLAIWLKEEELEHLNETILQLNSEIDDFLSKS